MMEKSVITALSVLIMATLIKATNLGMKLMIMMAAGLAGMYMMHLLAQDYNKYQSLNRPGRSIHEIVKRSVHEDLVESDVNLSNIGNVTDNQNIFKDIEMAEKNYQLNEIVTLDRILQFDPTGCARRYVCTIAAKSPKKRNQYENNIIQMLRSQKSAKGKPNPGQEAFNFALNLGRKKKDAAACAEEYSKCLFSVSQMLKLVGVS